MGAHGLVHQYTAFLNKCSEFGSKGSSNRNGKYKIVGATASTVKPGVHLTVNHCNGNNGNWKNSVYRGNGNWKNSVYHTPVYHGSFSLVEMAWMVVTFGSRFAATRTARTLILMVWSMS